MYDFWQGKYLGVHREKLTVEQAPHATSALIVSRVTQEPKVIASSFHISGGAAEIKTIETKTRGLSVELEKAGRQRGELVFAVPAEWGKVNARVNRRRATVRQLGDGVIAVRLTLDERATVEVEE